jgi:desulfoferrodoxin (superoxide reductase-like protein)
MKQTVITLTLIVFILISCQKEGGNDETADPIKPQDEYTKENPGEWKAVAKDHAPLIELGGKLSPNNIKVTVPGSEFNDLHYIEKIGLIDKDKKELVGKSLEKGVHEASLTFKYDPDSLEDLKIYVKCNLHDVWTMTLDKASVKK